MFWHVPNGTPLSNFRSAARHRYRTTNGFLQSYGGNFKALFDRFPVTSQRYGHQSVIVIESLPCDDDDGEMATFTTVAILFSFSGAMNVIHLIVLVDVCV